METTIFKIYKPTNVGTDIFLTADYLFGAAMTLLDIGSFEDYQIMSLFHDIQSKVENGDICPCMVEEE